jgi:hypothetical protein
VARVTPYSIDYRLSRSEAKHEEPIDKLDVSIRPEEKERREEQKTADISGLSSGQKNVEFKNEEQDCKKPRSRTQKGFDSDQSKGSDGNFGWKTKAMLTDKRMECHRDYQGEDNSVGNDAHETECSIQTVHQHLKEPTIGNPRFTSPKC